MEKERILSMQAGVVAAGLLLLAIAMCLCSCAQQSTESSSPSSSSSALEMETKTQSSEASDSDGKRIDHIEAVYNGSKAPGTFVGASSDITVRVVREDGHKEAITKWTLANPGNLPESGQATFTVQYGHYECNLVVDVQGETTSASPSAASEPDYAMLDTQYEEIDVESYNGNAFGAKVRASFMVDRIYETEDGNTEVVAGDSGTDPAAIVIMSRELGDQVNDHTEITFYGTVTLRDAAEYAGAHTTCYNVDYLRIDSRELEQYVKPNQVSDARK